MILLGNPLLLGLTQPLTCVNTYRLNNLLLVPLLRPRVEGSMAFPSFPFKQTPERAQPEKTPVLHFLPKICGPQLPDLRAPYPAAPRTAPPPGLEVGAV